MTDGHRSWRLSATLLLGWALLCGPAIGEAAGKAGLAETRAVIKKLQASYRRTQDLQADFTQRTRIQGFATPLSSTGRVYIKKPGRLRWDYREPNVEEIYVNKDRVYMYVPAHEQVLVGDLTRMTASRAPLRLLQGVAKLEEEFQVVKTVGDERGAGGLPLLTLLPKTTTHESVQNVAKIVVEVDPKTFYIATLHIHEVSGNVSTFEFTNIEADRGLADELFTFTVPPGVEVVRAPSLGSP